jgi:hypothetical protein
MRRIITVKFTLDATKRNMPDTDGFVENAVEVINDNNDGDYDVKAKVLKTTEKDYEVAAEEDDDEIG